ncbi:MAG: L-threonylcarbamoyladenylate synthase [Eubacteriales bacterium]|nr:L-threonylcarbamoyladenylate synthase [Eubacteriales bacterium]
MFPNPSDAAFNIDTKIITPDLIEQAARCVREGGLVVFPTETVYGLGANALDSRAAKRIYAAKGRPSDNPLICHMSSPDRAEIYCETNELYYRLARRFMPGPLTVILPKKNDKNGVPVIPDSVTGGLATAAVRVPSNAVARELIERAGVPVAAPSANISGRPSPTALRHVIEDMYGRADMIIDGGESEIGLESTVITIDRNTIKILRPGAVTPEDLRGVCGSVTVDPAVCEKFDGVPLSPGMKYRHYAPRARVIMLEGEDEAVYGFLADKQDCGILCYDTDTPLLDRPGTMSMGKKEDHATQARRLFACLRDLDGVEVIYTRMPSRDGLGLAVYNRLIKAAGYEVISL